MFKTLRLSLFVAIFAGVFAVGAYAYSLWTFAAKDKAALPVEGVSVFTKDLMRFHSKRGGFPEDLSRLEGVVWEKKERALAANNRALTHKNYYYFYNRISPHLATLWAIPTGEKRDEATTWFLVVTHGAVKRWKGAPLPIEQINEIEPNPSVQKLGVLGLIEQPAVDLKSKEKATSLLN